MKQTNKSWTGTRRFCPVFSLPHFGAVLKAYTHYAVFHFTSCWFSTKAVHGRRYLTRWLKSRDLNSEDPGFDPLALQGEEQTVLLSLRVNSCADLFVPDPPSCERHAPTFVHRLKIPYPSVVKRVGSHSRWYGNTKTLHTGKKNKSGSAVLWLLAFRGESSLNFPSIALGQENDLLYSLLYSVRFLFPTF